MASTSKATITFGLASRNFKVTKISGATMPDTSNFAKCELRTGGKSVIVSFSMKNVKPLLNPIIPGAINDSHVHSHLVHSIAKTYKIAILGASGGIGQSLALLIKMSPFVSSLHLYDTSNVRGFSADLSHCNTPCNVLGFNGVSELGKCLRGMDVVVILSHKITQDDPFHVNAMGVKDLIKGVGDHCPNAFIHIISNPLNSIVPFAAEILKQNGVYDDKKLFGVTTLDVIRASTFAAKKKDLRLVDADVPVVGGNEGITILPLLSKSKPSRTYTAEEVDELTLRIRNAGNEVVVAKEGARSASLSMAYAAARFVESSFRALDGEADVYECSYMESDLTELPFFASKVRLGRYGAEEMVSSVLQGLTEFEEMALEALKPELRACIEKGIAYARK